MYKACRLRSFINQKSPSFSGIIGGNKKLEAEQLKAFKSMIEAKEAEKDIIEQQLLQKKEALNILEAKKTTLDSNVKLIAEEKNLKRQLVEKGHLSKFKYIQIQKQYNDTNGLLKETESAIVQAKNSIDEYQDRLESLSARHVDEA
ncbi:MAG: hypothetical protein HRU35_07320 [Rickettsiaceae bacterium]|nr:hypothetical protein [Rickettsiaceae bacterium]